MKNQDPTNSQKSHEMAAQLAQFTSLEQLFNVNDNLKNMQTQQEPVGQFQALNLIGKSVSGDTSRLVRVAGDKKHDFSFDLNGDAKDVKISVANETGQEIRSFSLSDLKKGTNRISWNGLDSQDNPTPSGNYRVSVEARDDRGKAVNAVTEFGGQITGVTFGKEGPILMIGDQKIRFSDVKTIVDSTLLKDKSEVKTLNLDSTESPQVKENKINTVASSPVLQGVGLSQGMMKKLIETKE
jgi:flagellar basal-body rod modification protein FlgD